MSDDPTQALLKELLAELRKPDEALWDIDDIAEYFKTSRQSARKKLVAQHGFPPAIKPSGFGRRWVPEEVKKWANRQREY